MSQLDENLALAKRFCLSVPKSLKNGPSNLARFRGQRTPYRQCVKLLDDAANAGQVRGRQADAWYAACRSQMTESEKCVSGLRQKYRSEIEGGFQWRNLTELKTMVQMAEQTTSQCGNCGEMAAKVFVMMEENYQSAAVMSVEAVIRKTGEPDDHQFVVIGGDGKRHVDTDTTFPREAVVCDPWAYTLMNDNMSFGAYPASELGTKLNLMLKSWYWSNKSVKIFRKAKKPNRAQLQCANNSRQGVCLR